MSTWKKLTYSDHTHDYSGVYSPLAHNHDSVYAALAGATFTGLVGFGGAPAYYMDVLGVAGADRLLFRVGETGFSNGFTVQYDVDAPAKMIYSFLDGNVGLATASPLQLLDLTTPTGDRLLFGGNGANVAANAYYNAGWKYVANGYANVVTVGDDASGEFVIYTAASGVAGNAITLNDRFHILTGGNVGVGTGAPISRLSNVAAADDNIAADGLAWWSTGNNWAANIKSIPASGNSFALLATTSGTTSSDIPLWVGSGASGGTGRLVVLGDGKVKIGYTGAYPGKLTVAGSIFAEVAGTDTVFSGSPGETNAAFIGDGGYWALRSSVAHAFNLDVYNGGSNKAALTVLQDGKTGVGTVDPTASLDVAGDTIRLRTTRTPSGPTAAGNAGDICWDTNRIYVCVATNTWKYVNLVSL